MAFALWDIKTTDIALVQNIINSTGKCEYLDKYRHKAHDKIVNDLIEWYIYNNHPNCADNDRLFSFMQNHTSWPDLNRLQVKFENITGPLTPEMISWFDIHPPITGRAQKLYYQSSKYQNVKTSVEKIWQISDMSISDEADFYKQNKHLITASDTIVRVEKFIWENKLVNAANTIKYLPPESARLFEQILLIIQKKHTPVDFVTKKQMHSELYLYAAAEYFFAKKNHDKVMKFIKFADRENVIHHPEKWHKMRMYEARELFEIGAYAQSYNLAKAHKILSGEKFADSEWFSGWLALRFLNKPAQAYEHFKTLRTHVKNAVSKARAEYWMGRASSRLGQKENMTIHYKNAAKYHFTYYGQLAYYELHPNSYIDLKDTHLAGEHTNSNIMKNSVAKAGFILVKAGAYDKALLFLKQAVKTASSDDERYLLTQIAAIDRSLGVKTHKEALKHGVVNTRIGYPHLGKSCCGEDKISYLAHAIITQESSFDKKAESSAGAQGIMQIMPSLAKHISPKINLTYREKILKVDERYNIRLGTYHLEELMYNYNDSYILTIAAYNAGPSAVNKFQSKFGALSNIRDLYKRIDWIESIPYSETRGYVQMVLSNLQNYYSLGAKHVRLKELIMK